MPAKLQPAVSVRRGLGLPGERVSEKGGRLTGRSAGARGGPLKPEPIFHSVRMEPVLEVSLSDNGQRGPGIPQLVGVANAGSVPPLWEGVATTPEVLHLGQQPTRQLTARHVGGEGRKTVDVVPDNSCTTIAR